MAKFWAVWRDTGGSAPNKRHTDSSSAQAEAERLARQTGEKYYVLEAVGQIAPITPQVEWTEL